LILKKKIFNDFLFSEEIIEKFNQRFTNFLNPSLNFSDTATAQHNYCLLTYKYRIKKVFNNILKVIKISKSFFWIKQFSISIRNPK
jgi:hypothetical protein